MERAVLPEGTELGGYVLGPVLGSGGMGTVYRAVDADGMEVALKLLHPALAADPDARLRLRREVSVLQRLRLRGVAQVVDAELDGPEAFVVTEFILGQTLAQSVGADGPYRGAELADLAQRLVGTLAQVHRAEVIHRDIKPGNIMIGPDGPVLIDFGIAQEGESTRLTGTGLVIGTPGFVAPELITGGEPTPASDEWGLAAALAYAATGRVPFGEGRFDVVFGRVAAGQADVAGLAPSVAAGMVAALRPDPADRLRAGSLAEVLREAAAGTGPTRRLEPVDDADYPSSSPGFHSAPTAAASAIGPDTWPGALDEPNADWYDRSGEPDTAWSRGAGEAEWPARAGNLPGGRSREIDGGPGPGWPEADLPAERQIPKRRALLLALWLALSAQATVTPVVAGVIVGVIVLVGRACGLGAAQLWRWRIKHGARRADGLRLAAGIPWNVVRAAIGLVPGLAVGAAFGALTWVMLHYGLRTELAPGLAEGLGIGVAGIGVWAGPGSAETRYGTSVLLGGLTRRPATAGVLGLAAVAWAAAIAVSWLTGGAGGPLGWMR
jgi:hypothetical protein